MTEESAALLFFKTTHSDCQQWEKTGKEKKAEKDGSLSNLTK